MRKFEAMKAVSQKETIREQLLHGQALTLSTDDSNHNFVFVDSAIINDLQPVTMGFHNWSSAILGETGMSFRRRYSQTTLTQSNDAEQDSGLRQK